MHNAQYSCSDSGCVQAAQRVSREQARSAALKEEYDEAAEDVRISEDRVASSVAELQRTQQELDGLGPKDKERDIYVRVAPLDALCCLCLYI